LGMQLDDRSEDYMVAIYHWEQYFLPRCWPTKENA
jgi:hypothetical protein